MDEQGSKSKGFWVSIVMVVLTGVVGVLVGYFLLPSTARINNHTELRKEAVRAQYSYLQRVKDLCAVGSLLQGQRVQKQYYDPNTKKLIAYDDIGIDIVGVQVAFDTIERGRWLGYMAHIQEGRTVLESDIVQIIDEIDSFLKEHPFPTDVSATKMEASEWSQPRLVGRWVALHEMLGIRVEQILELAK